ncbi:MAG: hypothetical protein KY454_09285 [Actinobacteria bacterium]|nr:hypothetical protein [Actinomycetota bacterium]
MPNPDGSARCEVVDAGYLDAEGKMVRRVRLLPGEPSADQRDDRDGDPRPGRERRIS